MRRCSKPHQLLTTMVARLVRSISAVGHIYLFFGSALCARVKMHSSSHSRSSQSPQVSSRLPVSLLSHLSQRVSDPSLERGPVGLSPPHWMHPIPGPRCSRSGFRPLIGQIHGTCTTRCTHLPCALCPATLRSRKRRQPSALDPPTWALSGPRLFLACPPVLCRPRLESNHHEMKDHHERVNTYRIVRAVHSLSRGKATICDISLYSPSPRARIHAAGRSGRVRSVVGSGQQRQAKARFLI